MTSAVTLRAFELCPILDRTHLDANVLVECVELSGEWLFLGTTDGRLLQFLIHEDHPQDAAEDPRVQIRAQKVAEKKISQSHQSVSFIRCVSALNRVLVICDGQFVVLSMSDDLMVLPLAGANKLKGVHAAYINENPARDDPFSVQVCLAKKKQIIVVTLSEEKLVVDKIREMPDLISDLVMDGLFVCVALQSHYVICNIENGQIQDLFPFEGVPALCRVAKEEFLLSAPGDLGMFVTSAGVSERPPLPWAKSVVKLVFKAPYIISLCSDEIVAYSITDQEQKQSLHFSGGRVLGNFDGKILVSSASSLYAIVPIPAEIQIKNLLQHGLVDQALELAENFQHRGRSSREQFQTVLNDVRQRAGFVCLKKFDLERARELFIRGQLNPQELISLFPGLSSGKFTASQPHLHDYQSIEDITNGSVDQEKRLKSFLEDFLEYLRASEGENFPFKNIVDTAIIKLVAAEEPRKVLDHISGSDFQGDFEELKGPLESHQRFHALALLHEKHRNWSEALSVWASLAQNEIQDDLFPGIGVFLQKIIRAPDELLWRYGDLALELDQEKAIDVFIQKLKTGDVVMEEKALNFLDKYPDTHLKLLEHLVLDKESQTEKFHTLLATKYLERLSSLELHDERAIQIRAQFQAFIVKSNLIKPAHLMSRLESTDLHQEKAILYGKMGDHEKALKIMVHKLEDPQAGESYCDQIAPKKDSILKKKLLLSLIKVFLDPELSSEKRLTLESALVDLLNRRSSEMNPLDVLPLIPPSWSLATILPALTDMIATLGHEKRMTQVEANLSIGHKVNTTLDYYFATRKPITMAESSYCMLTSKQFREPVFVRYPNGIIVNPNHAKDLGVCPITGQVFKPTKGT